MLKYRLLTKSIQKGFSVESYNILVAHKIQQRLIFYLYVFSTVHFGTIK